jgi:putative sterol carrier protein
MGLRPSDLLNQKNLKGGIKMALYPSQEWCDEWKKALNNDPAVAETGKNWGVGFNGNFVFELKPGGGLEKTAYVYLEAAAGKCTDACLLDDPSTKEPGFYCIGSYADYKPVVKGEKDFIEGVVRGIFRLKGDMSKIMRNAKFIRAVANSISSFPNEYLGE